VSLGETAVLDLGESGLGVPEFLIDIFVVLVDLLQELELFALLEEELLVLLEEFLVSGEAGGVLADALIEGSLNGADVVAEGHLDELSAVDAHDLHATHLFLHVVLLAEDVALAQLAHQDHLLPRTVLVLQTQPLVDVGLALHEEEDLAEGVALLHQHLLLPETHQLR
jgi:hypothetical protein